MIIDGTNGLTFNNATTQASAGVVLQVVNATYSTQVSNSAGGVWADTGLTATITPKFSTSKILITWTINGTYSAKAIGTETNLLRGSTQIVLTETIASREGSGSVDAGSGTSGGTYLDSPATTSATTYKCQYMPRSGADAVYAQYGSSTSMMTLMEIAQ